MAMFGLPVNGLDHFEAEMAPEFEDGYAVPLVPHAIAEQIAEAVGDPLPAPYDGLRPYGGLKWHVIDEPWGYDEPVKDLAAEIAEAELQAAPLADAPFALTPVIGRTGSVQGGLF